MKKLECLDYHCYGSKLFYGRMIAVLPYEYGRLRGKGNYTCAEGVFLNVTNRGGEFKVLAGYLWGGDKVRRKKRDR